ncbi:hypothetical protein ABZ924_03180 [Streptomyces sp. NPDC046876]|uniref:hypothetical protein n=1 Tax=Streptomyces sp. NPDC046876 TaxID=3155616 RepID=UPI0033E7D743
MFMSITAQLRASVPLPGGEALINGFAFESRGSGSQRALLRNGAELEVYDLSEVFAGERAPTAVFPAPWVWDRWVPSVSPDGSFAVFSGQRAVRAVGADGVALWEYRHGCWGPELGHAHTGDEQEVCRGLEHGSCRVSDDGRLVWAHVVIEEDEYWVVLDARDGRELARLPLDGAASGSNHLSHPDGTHMALCIGMGQDGILLYWARWDGAELTAWDPDGTTDRILIDVHAGHAGFLTVQHYGADLELHALDGSVLAQGRPGEDGSCWDYWCGFVDADTVIAAAEDGPHRLLDARTLQVRGAVAYPAEPVEGGVRPLGDGTWLTYDTASGTLNRWTCAA